MKHVALLLFMLVFILCSCQRIEQAPVAQGELKKVLLEDITGIPSEYGTLISVTTHAQYEGWSQLWFVDSTNTIRMVRVQFHDNRIHNSVLVIPRN
jgi:hypothetical protein